MEVLQDLLPVWVLPIDKKITDEEEFYQMDDFIKEINTIMQTIDQKRSSNHTPPKDESENTN